MAKKGSIFEKDKDSEFIDQPEEFLETEEHVDTHAEHNIKISAGEQEADVYTEEGRKELAESGEISPWEEGFSKGAEGKGHLATCAHCDALIGDRESGAVEREFKGTVMLFCSEKCANSGPKN